MSRNLLNDDSSSQHIILSGILQKIGYEVDTVGNGQEALEQIEATSPDYRFLNNHIPVLKGRQTFEVLKAQNITLPIIMLTADIQK